MQLPLASLPIEAILGITIPFTAGVVVLLTFIVTHHVRRMQRDDMEATLKMEMIERGMSAEDIERVLAARMSDGGRRGSRDRHFRSAENLAQEPRAARP